MTLVHRVRFRNELWDSVNPAAIPRNTHAMLYINGLYAATQKDAKRFESVLWIDVTGEDPKANVLDIENHDATAGSVKGWVTDHVNFYGVDSPEVHARLYCNLSTWESVKTAARGLEWRYRRHIRYHIAHPTGVPHLVPGSHATQWGWYKSYDLSSFRPGYIL